MKRSLLLASLIVLALVSVLARYRWIDFKRRLSENDVLVRSACPEIILTRLRAQYGKVLDDLIGKFDGKKRIVDIMNVLMNVLPYDKDAIWFLINKLVEVGCLTAVHNN